MWHSNIYIYIYSNSCSSPCIHSMLTLSLNLLKRFFSCKTGLCFFFPLSPKFCLVCDLFWLAKLTVEQSLLSPVLCLYGMFDIYNI